MRKLYSVWKSQRVCVRVNVSVGVCVREVEERGATKSLSGRLKNRRRERGREWIEGERG